MVIVDDLGHGDVGFTRGVNGSVNPPSREVSTPVMDALAGNGTVLTRHYVHQMCTPSRTSFLSGRLPMHVQNALDNPEVSKCGMPYNMSSIAEVMKRGNWSTAMVGKYDLGMATHTHTPLGRGFDSSLIYFEHKNSYWDQTLMQSACEVYNPIVDLWEHNATYAGPARALNGTGYEEFIFRDRVLEVIAKHDTAQPLFLVYTPHVAHCPLQVPEDWLAKFAFVSDDEAACAAQTPYIFPGSGPADFRCRAQYHAMVSLLDEVLGNITDALRARGLWQDTLMVLSSDNGGPAAPIESGSSNWPLRGGKYSDFEGGIRVAAFASGGYLPAAARGTTTDGMIAIADWLHTFAALAGVDPTDAKAAAAGLPPIDSLNVWPLISHANATSPRTEIPVGPTVLLHTQYKLMLGAQIEATWGGPQYPNSSSVAAPVDPGPTLACGAKGGCLFDVIADPTEHADIAAQHPALVADMTARLTELRKGFWFNHDNFSDSEVCPPGVNITPCACWAATNVWGGYFGPWSSA